MRTYKAYTIFDTSDELRFDLRLVERNLVFLRRSKTFILHCTWSWIKSHIFPRSSGKLCV